MSGYIEFNNQSLIDENLNKKLIYLFRNFLLNYDKNILDFTEITIEKLI
jgi:hypothetical protein